MSEARAVDASSPTEPWRLDTGAAAAALGVDVARGLDSAAAAARLRRFGPNQLRAVRRRSALGVLAAQFGSIVIWLLVAAALVSAAFGDLIEALAIVAVIVINAGIGFATEIRAVRSIEALRSLGTVETLVRRDGRLLSLPADALVPGDIVVLEGGDIVTADLRIVEAARLAADESTLTGESLPVTKSTAALPAGTPLVERANMLFKGTAVTRGSGVGIVMATGMATELGRISELVVEADAGSTPLEKRLDRLARRLVGITLAIAALIGVSGVLAGRDLALAIEVAIALAVAAIPEGLPIVATIALARGMWRMAERKALVARLSAVETLGATSIILTDKTGTLTENRMTVSEILIADASFGLSGTGLDTRGELKRDGAPPTAGEAAVVRELLTMAALCNNASLGRDGDVPPGSVVGDPTEVALLVAAAKLGLRQEELLVAHPEVAEEPFDPATRAMATYHRDGDALIEAVKGAPEAVIAACVALRTPDGDRALGPAERTAWLELSRELGSRGLRTLALATRRVAAADGPSYRDLVLLGVVGVRDPARPGVREAIAACRDSGIAVVMVTGDHAATARSIAHELGLIEPTAPPEAVVEGRGYDGAAREDAATRARYAGAQVIARASPEQKLELIRLHQDHDRVVAMTGDGVNDAPALKQADIGIAMGQRGTQVAREAAAMVLQDDRFETIVEAVAQGRAIYANIRKFVVYLMSCNFSEILIVGLASFGGAPLPLLPLQILFLNLVTDVFPALALGVGEGAPGLMRRPPRPAAEPLLAPRHWRLIFAHGLVMSLTVLAAMAIAMYGLGFDAGSAVTVSFLTLALAQLWHVFNMRDASGSLLRNEIVANPWIWAAIGLCLALIGAAVYLPGLAALLSLTDPGAGGWAVVLPMSLLPLLLGFGVRRLAVGPGAGGPDAVGPGAGGPGGGSRQA